MSRLNRFRLQYASNLFVDLHKQKFDSLVRPVSPTLALLGNIGRPEDAKTYHFLNYCSRNWDKVLWTSGSHEHTKTSEVSVRSLCKEFQNVRSLDGEEQVFSSENVVLLGLPAVGKKISASNLTHTLLRTAFWSATHPMGSLLFLSSRVIEKDVVPVDGTTLASPVYLWLSGTPSEMSLNNTLCIDQRGTQFFAANSCFPSSTRLQRIPTYSPIASVEIVDRSGGTCMSLQEGKHSLQLA